MNDRGFRNLEVYQISHNLGVRIHQMSLRLPKFEMYEEGAQIRRSSKRVSASIVEGYAMRKYKGQYLFYLYRAHGSAEESLEHLEYLWETKSLTYAQEYESLRSVSLTLNRKLYRFIQGVEQQHTAPYSIPDQGAGYVEEDFMSYEPNLEDPDFEEQITKAFEPDPPPDSGTLNPDP